MQYEIIFVLCKYSEWLGSTDSEKDTIKRLV